MSTRIPIESRMLAAFLAAAGALVVVAGLVIASVRDFASEDRRLTGWLADEHVQSKLSSTTDAAVRDADRSIVTGGVRALLAEARAIHASGHKRLEIAEAWSAVFGALALVLAGVALSTIVALLRERRDLAERLAAERNHDALTGLPNRRFFTEWLAFAIAHARRENTHVGVLHIDINGCAAVAELHGGPAVESLLVEIARRFRAASREGDVFARVAPTEFALATPNASDSRELALLAQRLRDVLNDPAQPPLADTPIGTAIGVAFFPEHAADSAGILAAASAAMTAARRAGRNHLAFNAVAA
jgi:diguanylate cyclase (GGDEF)-like protein